LNTLCTSSDKLPNTISRPFDKDRSGFVIGEGSGILVLEEYERAKRRDAKIYCEIVGYATYGDAYHITRPTENGEGGYRTMAKAIFDADITPYDIDLINCHATSTDVGDLSELNALTNLFGNSRFKDKDYFKQTIQEYNYEYKINEFDKARLLNLVINCNKTFFGHLLGAAGSVESIFGILALKNNKRLNNVNTTNPISNYFKFHYDEADNNILKYCLKNSFAFGGVNTSILYKNII
jgi:3-oxoacyl-[acyl-carrier-protein] synthase II